ncbi:MAG TPA: GNAT family N-acetyltransferase [Noviherbaspirillum sp.]|uniref:GNAT family N-acetyltransferase n=1 Tax=Noviherbaspirillum sp. TaxID=1926288 RepID=UPI002DDD9BB4|nr:GNAT family N-acetyltransferase [Noviherbaspirillum sp.]HEV2608642.1 GNAT family N-acetyltransferase [Noviherbaspirillum sp.]
MDLIGNLRTQANFQELAESGASMLSAKEKYRMLCKEETSIPVFSRDWWLDATAGVKAWDVALVEKGGHIVAALPYSWRRRFGLKLVGQPALTPALGPWFAPFKGSNAAMLRMQKECMETLILQLPRFDHFSQSWNHRIRNWLPFYWEGFNQTTRYTYTIPLRSGLDVLAEFSSNMRNKVRKAQKLVTVIDDCPVEVFFELNRKTFSRQRLAVPYSLAYVKRIDAALAARDKRKIFAAVDETGRFHSALYLIWDDETGYVHMVGEDPDLRQSGAGILLIHEAIQFCIRAGLKMFDFVGSMIKGVEIVRRSCGGTQTAYFHITKTRSRLLLMRECMLSVIQGK